MSDVSGPRDRRAGRPARILLVNPNTNAATTEMMRRVATASLDPATPATLRAVIELSGARAHVDAFIAECSTSAVAAIGAADLPPSLAARLVEIADSARERVR